MCSDHANVSANQRGGENLGCGVGVEERRAKQGRVKAWQREERKEEEDRHAWKVIKAAWLAADEDRDVLLAPWHTLKASYCHASATPNTSTIR